MTHHVAFGHRRVTDVAVEVVPPQGYRSPLWHEARMGSVSASEIPAVLGISPYQSRFDLWWAKRNGEHGSDDNAQMRRGRRVEPLIIDDFREAHPEFNVATVGLVSNVLRGWQVCTPDGLVFESSGEQMRRWRAGEDYVTEPVATLEAKSAASGDGWGERGTDQVPVHYRAQVLWQMDVLGLPVAYVPVWVGFDYREYVVEYDLDDVLFMRDAARDFLDSLEKGEPPEVDGHPATTVRLKRLHPKLEDTQVEVSRHVLAQYQAARRLADAATERKRLAENRLRAQLGAARVATLDGRKVASRSVYDVKASVRAYPAYVVDKLHVTKKPPGGQSAGGINTAPSSDGVSHPTPE